VEVVNNSNKQQRLYFMAEQEKIIGEIVLVDDDQSLKTAAVEAITEASILVKNSNWRREISKEGIQVESKKVLPPFLEVDIFRGTVEVECPNQALFELISGPDGFKILNPDREPEDHDTVGIQWGKGGSLSVHVASVKMPFPLKQRELVVLKAIDPETCTYTSKSVVHGSRPGASRYFSAPSSNCPLETQTDPQEEQSPSETRQQQELPVPLVPWGNPDNPNTEVVRGFTTFALVVEQMKLECSKVTIVSMTDVGLNSWAQNSAAKNHMYSTLKRIQVKALEMKLQLLSEARNHSMQTTRFQSGSSSVRNRTESIVHPTPMCIGCDFPHFISQLAHRIKKSMSRTRTRTRHTEQKASLGKTEREESCCIPVV